MLNIRAVFQSDYWERFARNASQTKAIQPTPIANSSKTTNQYRWHVNRRNVGHTQITRPNEPHDRQVNNNLIAAIRPHADVVFVLLVTLVVLWSSIAYRQTLAFVTSKRGRVRSLPKHYYSMRLYPSEVTIIKNLGTR